MFKTSLLPTSVILTVMICLFSSLCESYKVAVVEYHKEVLGDFEANIKHNLNNYLRIIDKIVQENQKKVDLIVFPEATLVFQTSFYTKEELLQHASHLPSDNLTIPCFCLETHDKISFYVRDLSCASKTHRVYISANIMEKNAANEVFNTNIVFDRQGRLVSKYRKMKPLQIERYVSAGSNVEFFETDFGVTFGVFICFDIFFKDTFEALLERNVDAFIFPSYWYSELPNLSSIQVQKMWSYLHDKVLFASGGNNGSSGTSGTGIYSGRTNAYASYLSGEAINKILISEVSTNKPTKKHEKQSSHIRNLKTFRFIEKQPEMRIHALSKYYQRNKTIEETLCEKEFCCKFTLNVNDTSGLVLTIYNGLQEFIGFGSLGIQLCTVLQCDGDNCFTIPHQSYFQKHFHHLQVKIVNATLGADYYPNLALNNLQFMPMENAMFSDKELQLQLTTKTSDIYVFGFYGRNYKIDELTKAKDN